MANSQSSLMQQIVALHRAGQLQQAIAGYRRVLAATPGDPDALHMLGVALAQSGRPAEGLPLLRLAVERFPGNALVHRNLGNALIALKRRSEALTCYQRAAELAPERFEMHDAVCQTALALRRYPEAVASSGRALALQPSDPALLLNRASALTGLKRFTEALECCDRASTLWPDHWGVHAHRGIALAELGRLAEAEESLSRSVALNSSSPIPHYDLGSLYGRRGRHELALASFARALELKPDYLEARWNIALLRLLRGELREGWALYESRFARDERRGLPQRFTERAWTGCGALAGQRILLWHERGLGDTLQFSRYAPILRDLGADVTLEVQVGLRTLLTGQFPGVRVIGSGEPVPDFDYQCPLLSVPRALGTELDSIPANVPYLRPDPAAVERWSRRLPGDARLRVGIAWQGNAQAERNWASGRSWPLAALEPLSRLPGVRLVSLQTGPGAQQLAAVGFADRIVNFGEDLDAGPDAFIDSASIVMNLDLVVSSDTSVVHLAGALGVPVWVALHASSEWRWLLERSDSPWYPTMRLFRQQTPGDWDPVVADIRHALERLPSGPAKRQSPDGV